MSFYFLILGGAVLLLALEIRRLTLRLRGLDAHTARLAHAEARAECDRLAAVLGRRCEQAEARLVQTDAALHEVHDWFCRLDAEAPGDTPTAWTLPEGLEFARPAADDDAKDKPGEAN